jgi:tetratricopeptide (TPR) repeat protein
MAKKICTVIIIVSLYVLPGCQGSNTGTSRMLPDRTMPSIGTSRTVNLTPAGEIDIVENMAAHRQAYREGLELLVRYYTKTGDNHKLDWAKRELNALNVMPWYNYLVPVVAANTYRATTMIPDADLLYEDARLQKEGAEPLGSTLFVDKNAYRMALRKFEDVINKYPNSDKIDDAAYMLGEISEYFRDYSIALEYYKRAYTWDPDTPHPARFKAARILDKYLHRNAEALELYKKAVEIEGRYDKYRELKTAAEERINALQKTGESQP